MSKLDSFIRRMQAQRTCIEAACELIGVLPGIVLELGLGVGRTYSHLSEKLPDREIYVFDRQVLPHVVCVPPATHLVLGELADTLPNAVERFCGAAALVHMDIGSADIAYGMETAEFIARHLPAALAPGAVILSDQALSIGGTTPLALPEGVAEGRYHMYRAGPAAAASPAPNAA
jgi:hypothetical protein